ncbi:hypothetical protein [Streptomyces olivaceoviridis]
MSVYHSLYVGGAKGGMRLARIDPGFDRGVTRVPWTRQRVLGLAAIFAAECVNDPPGVDDVPGSPSYAAHTG